MGCDIHVHIEYRRRTTEDGQDPADDPDSLWYRFAEPRLPRCYKCFSALAGVRPGPDSPPPLFPPRGLPVTEWDDTDGTYAGMRSPESHSHGHLSFDEMMAALEHAGINPDSIPLEYKATLAAMRTLAAGYDVRLVFCFDN